MDDNNYIDFDAQLFENGLRASTTDGPYLVVDGPMDDCIRQFMSRPTSQYHLYEIHTAPQAERITAVLWAEQIIETCTLAGLSLSLNWSR